MVLRENRAKSFRPECPFNKGFAVFNQIKFKIAKQSVPKNRTAHYCTIIY